MPFCKLHLPMKDSEVILEDESGDEFPIKYIAYKTGLSAGWRKFVTGNKLLEGDALVFQLIEPCRFKVHVLSIFSSNTLFDYIFIDVLVRYCFQKNVENVLNCQRLEEKRNIT